MLQALSFLTIVGRGRAPSPRAMSFFPIVGALVGLAVGAAWWGAVQLWPPLVAAVIAVVVDVVVTGMLHLDGLSDAADGLLAPMDRDRRLTVMRDPSVGAFGAVTLIVVLLLRVAALASVPVAAVTIAVPDSAPLVIAAIWCVSRTAMAVMTGVMRYARADGGIASAFQHRDGISWRWLVPLLIGAAIAFPLGALGGGLQGILAVVAAIVGAALVASFAQARLGGFTGDVLGAGGVIAETAGLLVLAAS